METEEAPELDVPPCTTILPASKPSPEDKDSNPEVVCGAAPEAMIMLPLWLLWVIPLAIETLPDAPEFAVPELTMIPPELPFVVELPLTMEPAPDEAALESALAIIQPPELPTLELPERMTAVPPTEL
jgi:hypothetical protein